MLFNCYNTVLLCIIFVIISKSVFFTLIYKPFVHVMSFLPEPLLVLTEHCLEFLSLKGGCTGLSESTLVKIPHCWKSHIAAHLSTSYHFYHMKSTYSKCSKNLNTLLFLFSNKMLVILLQILLNIFK